MEKFGEQFIHQKNQKLHTSDIVEHEKKRLERKGEKTSDKPIEKISDWLNVLERTHLGHQDDPRVLERIKDHYHKEYVIKEENIPESAFILEQRIARNQGHGDVEIDDNFIQEKTNQIIGDQKHSLNKWIDYLSSSDADYPMWAKYWSFNSMLKMGKLEKEESEDLENKKAQFKKRKKDTVAPFPPLNPRALAMTISAITSKAQENNKNKKDRISPENLSTKLSDEEFNNLINSESFSKLYAQFLMEMPEYSKEGLQETRGEWIVYKKGSEPDKLVESLDGYPLEWCTANIDTARTQLQGGDFHVYYSLDGEGEPKIPRVAIRKENDKIAEVRGIAPDQNMDPYIGDVVEEKMTEFPDGEEYRKKTEDMKRLTEIEDQNNKGEELSKEDLIFLYEIDSNIEGFGYQKDPRVEEIIQTRNIKVDLSLVTGFKEDEISLSKEEALSGNIKYHYGSLNLDNLESAEGLELPETINGGLFLNNLESAEGLNLPETIGGGLNLQGLKSAEGLELPETINGYLILSGLESAEGLELPETIGGGLNLQGLKSIKGLELPKTINGYLNLSGLKSAEGIDLPETINEGLFLDNLESAEGLDLPETINGDLHLSGLESAEGLELPETINGDLNLSGLESAEGLELPEKINENLYLDNLESAEGLNLPETINGYLILSGLKSTKGLKLPETINGGLDLESLKSTEGLKFPETINRDLYLNSLESTEGLKLPETINGDLYLNSLESTEGLKLPETINGDLYLNSLELAKKDEFRKKYPEFHIV